MIKEQIIKIPTERKKVVVNNILYKQYVFVTFSFILNMSDDFSSGEDVILLCLQSVNKDQICMDQLLSIGINVYEFDDADEYVQYLLSIRQEDIFIFVCLGFGRNHLIDILHEVKHVYCIYLCQSSDQKHGSKVHVVFIDPTELVEQVLVDGRACRLKLSAHLNVFHNQETPTTQDQQGNIARALWSQMLLQIIILMPAPPNDMHRDLLIEARYYYRDNPTQIAQINDFEQNYQSDSAIYWYSRDSFAYRLVNKALRTQNLAIIFKFRFFIRDVYMQLKKLHHDQYITRQTVKRKCSINITDFFSIIPLNGPGRYFIRLKKVNLMAKMLQGRN
jgi:hypothetical protein